MSQRRPLALPVYAGIVLVGAGLLWWNLKGLSADIAGPPSVRQAARPVAPKTDRLHEAAAQGDLAAIKAALSDGADVNAVRDADGQRGLSALMAAAMRGSPDAVRALLDAGATIDMQTQTGRTALMLAAGWNGPEVVKALIERKARVDAQTAEGFTPLMLAAARGDAASLQALIDADAGIDTMNKWRQTALMIAAREAGPAPDKVQALLRAGASATLADADGQTALCMAAGSAASPAVLAALIDAGAKVNIADKDGLTPLMRAAERGERDKVLLLLNAGANPAAKDSSGRTALDWARDRTDEAGDACGKLLADASAR